MAVNRQSADADRPIPDSARPAALRSDPACEAIAIVGLSGRFPGADGLTAFWRNLREGVESLERLGDADLDAAGVPEALRADPRFVRRGTALDGAEMFDAGFFGMAPREAQLTDPQQRLFLECAWEALEDAGHAPGTGGCTVGVFAGASMNTWLLTQLARDPALLEAAGGYQLMIGNDKDFLCTRAAYKLDLRGPAVTIQTACSTSLVAVEAACRALRAGECDLALAGGVSVTFPQRGGYLHQEGMIFSPDGHCRPFDAAAAGTRAGAGLGLVVLRRLADAVADRDDIRAVIRGAAVNNDGAGKVGFTAPSIDGQAAVIRRAQAQAGIEPRSIGYVEAHGTATPLGDPVEIAALTRVFRESTDAVGFCRLGSLKANLGHLDAAAGVAGLIKAVLAVQHGEIPPLVNFRAPNPALALDTSPFAASADGTPWPREAGPRRAGVSSFGIGGTNAHVVIEEAPPAEPGRPQRAERLLVLSARSDTALERAGLNLADWLEAHPDAALADVEWTLQAGRRPFPHRRALVVRDAAAAVRALRQPATGAVHEGAGRPVAFLFGGQGSQHPGMGAGLYRTEAVYRDAIDRCAAILEPVLGFDLRALVLSPEPGDGRLDETRYAQPALFCTEYALARLWMSWGVRPQAMLGHSIGEYVAAHLAGVMSLANTLSVVAARGRLMQALPPGRMAAVPLSAEALAPLLPPEVEIAARNAPALCTVAGPEEAVAALLRDLAAREIEGRPIHTAHAFHSAMMAPAMQPFAALLAGITLRPPTIPYVSNVTGDWITPAQATAPAYYADQLRHAVQFEAGLACVAADPSLFLLEVGPGTGLTSLVRANLGAGCAGRSSASLPHPQQGRSETAALLDAASRLWLAGVPLDWAGLQAGTDPRRVPLPTYPFERRRYAVDAPSAAMPRAAPGAAPQIGMPDGILRAWTPGWLHDEAGSDQAADGPRFVGTAAGTWMVFGDPGPLTAAVEDRFRAAGAAATVRASSAESDMAAQIRAAADAHGPVAGAVVLWGGDGDRPSDPHDLLVALAAGLAAAGAPVCLLVATVGARRVLDGPTADPDAALAFGPALVLPLELPGLRCRAVDLDPAADPSAAAAALLAEAASTDAEAIAAWRAGRRWLPRYLQAELPEPERAPLRPGGRYLITGGLGGMGLALARWLAETCAARVLLTGRRSLPPRAAWDAAMEAGADAGETAWAGGVIREIVAVEAAGGEVLTAAADAADAEAMAAAIALAQATWGGIDGVIHAAGVPGSGSIALRKREGEARAVIAPKRDGLAVLSRLLGGTELDFVALMGSINSVLPAPGLSDYASANAVLDAFAEGDARPAGWRRVVAVDWGPWRDVGMAANLAVPDARRAAHAAMLRHAIAPAEGAAMLGRVLAGRSRRVVVTTFDLPAALALVTAREVPAVHEATVSTGQTPVARPALATAFEAPADGVEAKLAAIWTELTGIAGIGARDDFFELGGHSLLATRLLSGIETALGAKLSLRDVFEAPTIGGMAARIAAKLQAEEPDLPLDDDREEILF